MSPGVGHLPVWMRDLGGRGPRGLLAWQATTSAVGIFMATALMALYLVGPAGLSDRTTALTLLGSSALCLVATPLAGRAIRTLGARRFAIASCLSRGALFVILPLSVHPAWTIGVVLLVGLCEAAAFSVYQLIIADAVGEESRTDVLAVRRTLGNVGFTLGGMAVGVVVGVGSRAAYSAAFVACGVALVVAALFLLPLPEPGQTRAVDRQEHSGPRAALRDLRFLGLIAAATVMASSMHLLTVGVPLWVVRHTRAPGGVVGALLIINTVLVVVLQVRLARGSATWSGARRAVISAGVLFAVSVLLMALSARVAAWAAVVVLVVATVLAAVAEMWDSAGWWTLSYEYASPAERPDYLAAFDVVTPAVNIAGPPLMIWIASHETLGWAAYAALFLVSAGLVLRLAVRGQAPSPMLVTALDNGSSDSSTGRK
ncbi:MFS transporter [Monashia sp. NPDC004114]